jgi:hypothetical protein
MDRKGAAFQVFEALRTLLWCIQKVSQHTIG